MPVRRSSSKTAGSHVPKTIDSPSIRYTTGSAVGPYLLVKTRRPTPPSASSSMHSASLRRSAVRQARRSPPLTTSSRHRCTTAAGSPALTSDGPRSSAGGIGSGLVEDGGDPAGGPAKGHVAKGGSHVDEGVVALGPDVQLGVAASQLPALGHQDGLIAQRVQGADGEQRGRQTGQVVHHRRQLGGAPLVHAVTGQSHLQEGDPPGVRQHRAVAGGQVVAGGSAEVVGAGVQPGRND